MTDRTFTIPIALRGGPAGVPPINTNFPANTWNSIQFRLTGTDWTTLNNLWFAYSARVSIDGGLNWIPWGGTAVMSQDCFAKDMVTRVGLGGLWDWDASFHGGGIISVVVDCPTAFNWGALLSCQDADLNHAVII